MTDIRFNCLFLTIIYLVLVFTGGENGSNNNILRYLGLFVPFGPWGLMALLSFSALPESWYAKLLALPLFVAVLFYGNIFGAKYIPAYFRIFFNALILFCLTICISMIIFHMWPWQPVVF